MARLTSKVFALATTLLVAPVMFQACASGDEAKENAEDDEGTPATTPSGNGSEGDGEGICLLNNCSSDAECGSCADGRNTCLVAENRCVACDPNTGAGCDAGQECSSFGLCVPEGLTCPMDSDGTPQVVCSSNADCGACSPMNQVCDLTTNSCVACTDTNTQHCLSSDICVDNACSPKCPSSCTADNDCGQCGAPGQEAHACNAHQCAECSDTYPCAAGLECMNGTCVAGCGLPNSASSGDCTDDSHCAACGDANDPGQWVCKKAINANGPNDHGTCSPGAVGCSDLGQGVAVLPDPWNDYTNSCSNDGDCAGVGIQLNVGELIRDAIGSDTLDLGFADVEINDAYVDYNMPKCADIELQNDISCGICVPCETDSDCAPIELDPLLPALFKDDPLAVIAGAMLIDYLYGNNSEHNLNFQCLPVAGGYGVCAPCSNPMQACGSNSGGSNNGGGNNGGTCDHSPCQQGSALNPSCSSCAADVCAFDPYCCNTAWDGVCVNEAADTCSECGGGSGSSSSSSSSSGGGGSTCSHSECSTGVALTSGCSPCAADVCAQDSYCCGTEWDSICVDLAEASSACSC